MPYTAEFRTGSIMSDGSDVTSSIEFEGDYMDTDPETFLSDLRMASIAEGTIINVDEPVKVYDENGNNIDEYWLDLLGYDFYNPFDE